MRSFSNMWYWIGLAVMWSYVTHRTLGVPYDLIVAARRDSFQGQDTDDMVDLARIYVLRLLRLYHAAGVWMAGSGTFFLTLLATLGFWYRVEFAQALFFIAAPGALAQAVSIWRAQVIHDSNPSPVELSRQLTRHRMALQAIGLVSIAIAAVWGMSVNVSLPGWY